MTNLSFQIFPSLIFFKFIPCLCLEGPCVARLRKSSFSIFYQIQILVSIIYWHKKSNIITSQIWANIVFFLTHIFSDPLDPQNNQNTNLSAMSFERYQQNEQ